jgi:hypothetical protein
MRRVLVLVSCWHERLGAARRGRVMKRLRGFLALAFLLGIIGTGCHGGGGPTAPEIMNREPVERPQDPRPTPHVVQITPRPCTPKGTGDCA